ncbi:YdjC-like protein [Pseudovibrio axinellae]|uniref:YdjC-like protein n=1 Tax=Pseudovibrio axinellae TaxID=989403 RepID=A0A165T698_9HYPH|nr:ChbG/HpnK family deacetylase [Pseudovibrio axinellae]KZL05494.1 YdjC-like protein [Pseudovibrio axinellae]SEP96837.1 hypothetical protein SAMN05421798_101838 [Pseudovibrio axinellae]
MKRILLTSLEFGQSYGVDRAICDLIIAGRLSAVGCVVTGKMWSREFYQLRDVVAWAEHETMVGLTVTLSKPVSPLTDFGGTVFGKVFPAPWWYALRSPFKMLPEEAIAAEIAAQVDLFEEVYARPPAFVAIQGNLAKYTAVNSALITVLSMMKGREPALVIPGGASRGAEAIAKRAAKAGLKSIVSGPDLPMADEDTDLRDFFWHGINEAQDSAMVLCRPSYPDGERPLTKKQNIRQISSRENQLKFLISEEFPFLLMEKDIFLF